MLIWQIRQKSVSTFSKLLNLSIGMRR